MAIKIAHSRISQYCDPTNCYIGAQPYGPFGEACRSTFLNLMNWNQHGQIVNYIGPYDYTINGAYSNEFYIVTPVEDPIDSTQTTKKLGIEVQCWNATNAGGTMDPEWNSNDIFDEPRSIPVSATQDDAEAPYGEYFAAVVDIATTGGTSGYTANLLAFDGPVPANVSVYSLPEYEQTTAAAYRLAPGHFGAGQTLRGDLHNSVGTMCQYQNSRIAHETDQSENMIYNSKRCLFQAVHPAGMYYDGDGSGSLAWTDFWTGGGGAFSFKIQGRNLRGRSGFGTTTANVDIVYITTRDATTEIKFTSAETGDTYTKTFASTKTTPSLNVDTTSLTVDLNGDEILVECRASTAAVLVIHSLSMWEHGDRTEI